MSENILDLTRTIYFELINYMEKKDSTYYAEYIQTTKNLIDKINKDKTKDKFEYISHLLKSKTILSKIIKETSYADKEAVKLYWNVVGLKEQLKRIL